MWHVDIDLGHIKKVSRQHALIIYNFEDEFWEIKCLSNKYPLYINKKKITQNMKKLLQKFNREILIKLKKEKNTKKICLILFFDGLCVKKFNQSTNIKHYLKKYNIVLAYYPLQHL